MPKQKNADIVTIELQRNEARLLIPAILDRQIMMAADRAEGRVTDYEHKARHAAYEDVLDKIRKVVGQ